MKSVREHTVIQSAYKEAGTLRGAAATCGTTHKTVKRILEAPERAEAVVVAVKRERNFDGVREVVAAKIDNCQGRISAKRLLVLARAAGYQGSARNFRRLVAEEKAAWKQARRTNRRPANWATGDAVVFDWGQVGKLYVFCAVLAYSRVRFVRFSDNLGQLATLQSLAACLEYLGGVPKLALTDRMGCLVASQVAGVVVPVAEYERMATDFGFRFSASLDKVCCDVYDSIYQIESRIYERQGNWVRFSLDLGEGEHYCCVETIPVSVLMPGSPARGREHANAAFSQEAGLGRLRMSGRGPHCRRPSFDDPGNGFATKPAASLTSGERCSVSLVWLIVATVTQWEDYAHYALRC